MKIIILCVFLFYFMISSISAHPENVSYSIVAPKEFRPGSAYCLTAVCFSPAGDVDLNLRLSDSSNLTLVETRETLTNGKAKTITLQVPDSVPRGSYDLVVMGSGGLNFIDKHSVTVNQKTLLLFVQTDKAMYKPGQAVLFRAIAVHPDLKPYKNLVDVVIYDPVGNKIMQWLKQKNDTGVISQRLQLSDQTPLGDWKITVQAGENSFTKTFEVAEYVLPKFEVILTLPSFFLVHLNQESSQEDFQFSVSAKYTFGQMVKGFATVSVQLQSSGGWYRRPAVSPKKVMVVELKNGKSDIRMGIADLLNLGSDNRADLSYRNLIVSASVEETVSGISLSNNGTVPCRSQKHNIKFLDSSPKNFKPGLLYTGFLHLSRADGSPPDHTDILQTNGKYQSITIVATMNERNERNERIMGEHRYWHSYMISTKKNISFPISPSGYMKFSLIIADNATSVDLEATFLEASTKNLIRANTHLRSFQSRDNLNIQILFEGQHGALKAPEVATFSVISTEPIDSFQYEVMSKGNILFSKAVVGNLSTHHSFSVEITKELALTLAPTARVVVWLFTNSGEVVTDTTDVSVSNTLANEVILTFDRESATPSDNVTLTVNAYSGSYVGLLAVDQSVLLLKSGNDITQASVFHALSEFGGTNKNQYWHHPFDRKKRSIWWPFFIDGSDSRQILDNSGLFILTDGYIHSVTTDWLYDVPPFARAENIDFALEKSVAMKDEIIGPGDSYEDSDFSQIRTKFPETWLWTDAITGPNGSVTLQTSVPDTITSWIANAFAISDVVGLGVASSPAKLTVFKQFFISPNLPYSIIRGEEFALQVIVFNYMPDTLNVLVSVQESEYFEVTNSSKQIEVQSDDAVSVYFWIVAKSLGQIPINIKAISSLAGDAMRVMLLVKPEGVQQQYSTSVFVQTSASDEPLSKSLIVSLPPKDQLVSGSEHIELTVVGDVMGPSVQGLDNLLKMPYGCGEQNMLNFAPNTYILKYLSTLDKMMPDLKNKALNFMNLGYQRELTYQRRDGSFSAFGNNDAAGSIWLSAFVIKCFHQAKDYISVDDSKIAETMRWIISNQAADGSFAEPPMGKVIHADMQGGSSQGLSLTAYVLNALLENRNNKQVDSVTLQRSIALAQTYLESKLSTVATDPYALSIVAYAFARSNNTRVNNILLMLESLAKNEAGTKHWEKKAADNDGAVAQDLWRPPYTQSKAINIEMTSYVLLTYCYRNDLSNGLPIVKWIIAQRNANGGFSSTQDTVMALEALAEFAAMIMRPSSERNLEVAVTSDQPDVQHSFLPITAETTILLQSFQLPSNTTKVDVVVKGSGSALIQLNVLYNIHQTFDLSGISLKIDTTQKGNGITIKSCGYWTKKEPSGMVVMEINQLTGFKTSNIDKLKNEGNKILKRVENKEDKLILYFDEFTPDETCISVISEKFLPVSNIQDASIKVYPYYDPSEARTMLYKAPASLGLNSVCDECPQCCGLEPFRGTASMKVLGIWITLGCLSFSILFGNYI